MNYEVLIAEVFSHLKAQPKFLPCLENKTWVSWLQLPYLKGWQGLAQEQGNMQLD